MLEQSKTLVRTEQKQNKTRRKTFAGVPASPDSLVLRVSFHLRGVRVQVPAGGEDEEVLPRGLRLLEEKLVDAGCEVRSSRREGPDEGKAEEREALRAGDRGGALGAASGPPDEVPGLQELEVVSVSHHERDVRLILLVDQRLLLPRLLDPPSSLLSLLGAPEPPEVRQVVEAAAGYLAEVTRRDAVRLRLEEVTSEEGDGVVVPVYGCRVRPRVVGGISDRFEERVLRRQGGEAERMRKLGLVQTFTGQAKSGGW